MSAAVRRLAAVPVDQRCGALRHPVEAEGTLASSGAEPVAVMLTDISERGCQIVRPARWTSGMIQLGFGGFAPFRAQVVWSSRKAMGLRFEHPVHPALIAEVVARAQGRKPARRPLASGLVRRSDRERTWHIRTPVSFELHRPGAAPTARFAGTLVDLSIEQARIAADVGLLPGTALLVHLTDRQPVVGEVRAGGGEGITVHFAEPLSVATVEAIARGMWAESDG